MSREIETTTGSSAGDCNRNENRSERRELLRLEGEQEDEAERLNERANRSEISNLKLLVNKYKTRLNKCQQDKIQLLLMTSC